MALSPVGDYCRELQENVSQSPSFCIQQRVEIGVGLYSPHNLHHTDHMKNGTQPIAD